MPEATQIVAFCGVAWIAGTVGFIAGLFWAALRTHEIMEDEDERLRLGFGLSSEKPYRLPRRKTGLGQDD